MEGRWWERNPGVTRALWASVLQHPGASITISTVYMTRGKGIILQNVTIGRKMSKSTTDFWIISCNCTGIYYYLNKNVNNTGGSSKGETLEELKGLEDGPGWSTCLQSLPLPQAPQWLLQSLDLPGNSVALLTSLWPVGWSPFFVTVYQGLTSSISLSSSFSLPVRARAHTHTLQSLWALNCSPNSLFFLLPWSLPCEPHLTHDKLLHIFQDLCP